MSKITKYSNEWMLDYARNCEANRDGYCEVFGEDCDLQCIVNSQEYKEHMNKVIRKGRRET